MKFVSIIALSLLVSLPSIADEVVEFSTWESQTICDYFNNEIQSCSAMVSFARNVKVQLVQNENDSSLIGSYVTTSYIKNLRFDLVIEIAKRQYHNVSYYHLSVYRNIIDENDVAKKEQLGFMKLNNFEELNQTSFVTKKLELENIELGQSISIDRKIDEPSMNNSSTSLPSL